MFHISSYFPNILFLSFFHKQNWVASHYVPLQSTAACASTCVTYSVLRFDDGGAHAGPARWAAAVRAGEVGTHARGCRRGERRIPYLLMVHLLYRKKSTHAATCFVVVVVTGESGPDGHRKRGTRRLQFSVSFRRWGWWGSPLAAHRDGESRERMPRQSKVQRGARLVSTSLSPRTLLTRGLVCD